MERRPPNPVEAFLRFVEGFDSAVRRIDSILRSLDTVLASADRVLLSGQTEVLRRETPGERPRESSVPSPSYPGQSPESYCLECLSRHYLKALGLLEEAERFSMSRGEITPEARRRIELAMKEVVTAEEDLGTPIRDPELARMIDEIKVKQREWRKWLWSEALLTTQRDISKLREAIEKMREIVELTRRAAEYHDSKYGRCPYCEALIREVSSRFGASESEVMEAIYGLASDDMERVRESAERLKRIGAYEYVMKRVKEILSEIGGVRK